MMETQKMKEMIGECNAHHKFGQEMNPQRVIQMIHNAFDEGYKKSIRDENEGRRG